jgi:hypothetical protein
VHMHNVVGVNPYQPQELVQYASSSAAHACTVFGITCCSQGISWPTLPSRQHRPPVAGQLGSHSHQGTYPIDYLLLWQDATKNICIQMDRILSISGASGSTAAKHSPQVDPDDKSQTLSLPRVQ